MNKPGLLNKDDRTAIRAYQKAHDLKVDGKPGHQTVPHMLALIADLGRKFNAAKLVAVIAILCTAVALWFGMRQ